MQNSLIIPLLVSFNIILALLSVILLIGVVYFRYKYLGLKPAPTAMTEAIKAEKSVEEQVEKPVKPAIKNQDVKPAVKELVRKIPVKSYSKPVPGIDSASTASQVVRCGACGKDLSDGQPHYCPQAN